MVKKLSGIAYGQKTKQRGQSDTADLIYLENFLKERFHIKFYREWYVGFDKEYSNLLRIADKVGKNESRKFRWKNPDLLSFGSKYGVIIVELDGSVHDRKVAKTEERNELFRGAGIKLIVLNISDIKASGETIKKRLECEMLKLIGNGQC